MNSTVDMILGNYKKLFGVERPSTIYENSERVEWIVSESDAERINTSYGEGTVKVGEKCSQLPPAETIEKAWERLVKYFAQSYSENLQIKFHKTFGKPTEAIVKDYLASINTFIEESEELSIREAFEKPDFNNQKQEYLRLKHGYYKINICDFKQSWFPMGVYGEYFLFKEWLESKLKEFEFSPASIKPDLQRLNSIEEMETYFLIIANDYLQYTIFEKEGRNPNPKEPTAEYFEKVRNKTVLTSHIREAVSREFETRPLHYNEVINKLYGHANNLISKLIIDQKNPENWTKWDQIAMQLMGIAKSYKKLAETRNELLNLKITEKANQINLASTLYENLKPGQIELKMLFLNITKDLGKIKVVSSSVENYRITSQSDIEKLDQYLLTYYKGSAEANEANSISESIIILKRLAFYFNEIITAPIVEDKSYKDLNGNWQICNVVRNPDIDKFIKTKILVPVQQVISKLKELKELYPNDTLTLSSAAPNKEQTESKAPLTETLDLTKENKFNRMPMEEVREFFKPFTERKSKTGTPFLTPEQLDSFIDRAFLGNLTQPKLTFNVAAKGEKGFLCKRFVEFYNRSTSSKYWYDTEPDQAKYIRLMSDNFTNWDFKEIKSNFRIDITSKEW